MKKDSIIDFLGFIAVKLLSAIFGYLPLRSVLWTGRRIGDIALFFNVKRRSIAYANLKSAFPEKGCGEIKNILKAHYRNLGMSIVELLRLPVAGKRYLDNHVRINNFERIEEALKKQRGAILLTAHFGNWEISSLAASSRGQGISVFAREQKYKRLNELLNRYREMTGCKVITKGFSARDIIKTLRGNGIVGMLADQDAGSNGLFINFLNRPASVAQGPISFSLKTGAVILPSFIRRVANDRHVAEVSSPLEIIDTGDKQRDMKANLNNITRILEGYIRRFPEQWLWSHKRWKSTLQRTVLVLDDGKAGHLGQGMAVAEMVEEALGIVLAARGIEDSPYVKIKVIKVKFKDRSRRMLLDLCSIFAGRRCQGCLRCLSFCLDRKAMDEVRNTYADIIVSCGASTAALNIFLKYENNAKNIIIMKPGFNRPGKTDLVILPGHDAPRNKRGNVLITEMAPNRVRPGIDKTDSDAGGIGLLIGGDAKDFILEKGLVEKVVDGILKASEEADRSVFVTTSRRTSKEIESLLKTRLGHCERCKLLVIANEKNPEGTVSNILDNSQVVIVSPESISMISEAVTSGRHIVVFKRNDTKTKTGSKYERAIREFESRGYVRIADADTIYKTVKELLKEGLSPKRPDDRKKIIERMAKII